MTEAEKLAALSEAATQGVWNHLGYCGQDGNIQGPRQEQIASLSSAWGKSNQTGHQCFANAAFIVALVNAYRANQLVLIGPDAVEKMMEAMYQAEPDALYRSSVRKRLARAALAALGVKP